VGTDRGLVRLAAGSPAKTWTKQSGLAGNKVKAVTVGPDGAIWAASLPGGVTRIDPVTGKTRIYGQETGLSDDRMIALHFDAEQRLWVSASGGLFRSTGVGLNLRFERQVPPGTDERTRFSRFVGDRRGRVWVGSARGLYCWDDGRWTRFTVQDGLKAEAVTHIAEDSDGAIWVAYREAAGISRLNFTATGIDAAHFNKQSGLPSDYVLFLGMDARRRLWVGTDRGVAARESSGGWSVYTHEDGLVWDDCASNSFWAESDGTVWIGTLKGLSRFHPSPNPVPASAPAAVVTAVQYGLQSGDPAAAAQVSFRDRDFSVSFSGLSYISEKHVRFRYRLMGLDDRWVETGQREARYSSLPAGSYRFEVAARNPRSDWSVMPAGVSFRIVAPWWQTWWFRSLGAGALAALLVWAVRARMQQLIWERRRLEKAVRERTGELEMQKNMGERQKREIEELLRQSQEISRLKSEFLANMSHEIRTPMNGVIGMTQLVLNTSLDAEQRDYIATVRDSAEALMVVINDILDFSKIEAGKLALAHEPFPVRKFVADALMVFAWKAQERHLSLLQRVDPAVPDILVGDADRLRQVLLNLLGNAMKFTEQGEIAVAVTCPQGAAPGAGGVCRVQFSVQDTGSGIPRESQVMIFEAFAQADGSIRRRQGGTGLGLAICSKLVGLMGGHISVESAPGLGSTFEFTVPLAVATDGAAAPSIETKPDPPEEPPPAELPLRILLAEDNAINQKLAKKMLDKPGHILTVVDNGRSAWEAAVSGDFDLILMDLQMPEMDGFEATAHIREAELASGRHTPIVALTAHAMSGDREQCLRAGMDDYISKPIDFQALMVVIRKMAARQDTLP
jgi:signal transduction histidine kinase/streptogramin lyase/ActR/RegA family two-component response regulator